jgi:hypothetical protein
VWRAGGRAGLQVVRRGASSEFFAAAPLSFLPQAAFFTPDVIRNEQTTWAWILNVNEECQKKHFSAANAN